MSRPQCCRRIGQKPACAMFRPTGIAAHSFEEIVLSQDEVEALRLADLNGLYHEQAAASMDISRQTFGRIVDSARKKTAEALVLGKALRIDGLEVEASEQKSEQKRFKCQNCQHAWEAALGGVPPEACPRCKGSDLRSDDIGRDARGAIQERRGFCHWRLQSK